MYFSVLCLIFMHVLLFIVRKMIDLLYSQSRFPNEFLF